MTREKTARVVTLAVMAAAALIAVGAKSGWKLPTFAAPAAKPAPTPQDTVYAMLDAARAGNVKRYLNAYTGQMAAALRQSLAESTPERFARYLSDSNAAIKGVAVNEPQALTDREVKLRVEYVYQDRNEAQWLYLEKSGGEWKIARVDGAERVKTLVPWGTPVR